MNTENKKKQKKQKKTKKTKKNKHKISLIAREFFWKIKLKIKYIYKIN
jgi:hypothetical protein